MESSDEQRVDPPSTQRVQLRGLALSAVACRAFIEQGAGDPEATEFHRSILEWADRHPVGAELERAERVFLGTPLGQADQQMLVDASWRSEGAAVLAWKVAGFELPPYDVQADPHCLHNLIDDPQHSSVREELADKLDAWMKSQGDKGAATEEIAHTRKAGAQKKKKQGPNKDGTKPKNGKKKRQQKVN